jgi:hypothetical protein
MPEHIVILHTVAERAVATHRDTPDYRILAGVRKWENLACELDKLAADKLAVHILTLGIVHIEMVFRVWQDDGEIIGLRQLPEGVARKPIVAGARIAVQEISRLERDTEHSREKRIDGQYRVKMHVAL